jgi:hypothetical protein
MGITQQIGASSLIKPGVIDNTAARPASPFEGQAVYQKDTDQVLVYNGTAWVETASMLTKAPRGIISYTTKSAGTTNITTATTTLLTAPSFTLTSSRYIKITGRADYLDNANSVTDIILALNNGSGNVASTAIVSNVWPEFTSCIPVVFIGILAAGTYTYRMDISLVAGTNRVNHNVSNYVNLLIEDIGAA